MRTGSSGCVGAPSIGSLNSTESFKAMSRWKLLRNIFTCTRILWRFLGQQAKNIRIRLTVGQRLGFVENPIVAGSNPSPGSDGVPSGRAGLEGTRRTDKSRRPVDCGELPVVYSDARRSAKTHVSQNSSSSERQHWMQRTPPPWETFASQQSPVKIVIYNVALWSLVCDQHSTDHVDWGDWKLTIDSLSGTQSQKNVTYVSIVMFQAASIVLFRAAYFWLKFRESVCCSSFESRKRKLNEVQDEVNDHLLASKVISKGIYCRSKKQKDGTTTYIYEPRFKPPRERQPHSGASQQSGWIYVGQYDSPEEAKIVYEIAAFFYGKPVNGGRLEFGSTSFVIPPMSEQDCRKCDEDKRKWVKDKTKEVYEDFKKFKTSKLANMANRILGSNFDERNVAAGDSDDDARSPFGASQILADDNVQPPPLHQLSDSMLEDIIADPISSQALYRETVLRLLNSSDTQAKQFSTAEPDSVPALSWAKILQQLSSVEDQTSHLTIDEILENHGPQPFESAGHGPQLLSPILTAFQATPLGSILGHATPCDQFSFHQSNPQEDALQSQVNCFQQLVNYQKQRLEDFAIQKEILQQRVEYFANKNESLQKRLGEFMTHILHLQQRLSEAEAHNQELRCEIRCLRYGGATSNAA
uniref:AP2/ERF domain-containing protein n=1 Tax=Physcomitrium patens TaxID=3218 RepID=A0A2K1L3K2_PHYPA|nr:hypothetical protein PHYPA_003384 [Physcomitrium patens]